MRNFHIITLLAVGLFVAFAMSTFQPAFRKGGKFRSSGFLQPVEEAVAIPWTGVPDTACHFLIKPSPALTQAFHYDDGRVQLTGAAGSLPYPAELSVRELTEATLPPLGQGMVNVTRYAAGYRMLPDGMLFNEEISIVLPYDSALLPPGFTPEDIVTYYYDVQYGRWTAIARDSVDTREGMVHSKVGHFTDFINAVIKVPEMPETEAFTPTSIKELEAADPLEGLQLIQAPTANNSGTANLSYQLEIPAGRQGMQPNLALSYSSAGGNGWLGVGWDIPIPSVTVDTRWGVPRYESAWESEIYVYGGEQLVTMDKSGNVRKMPHRTNLAGQTGRLPDGERFYARAGEAHDSIIRHGTTPQDYWWEVTDSYGTTSYYGAYPPGDTTQGPTRIGGAGGTARWALAATVDANGNMVRYHYSMDYDAGGGQGRQLYLDSINYTGYHSGNGHIPERGIYTVVFNRTGGRGDIITSGRNGFKEVMAATLCNVQVKYNADTIRTFFFLMESGRMSNYKTRLQSLVRHDGHWPEGLDCQSADRVFAAAGKQEIVRYDFGYEDYPAPSALFSEPHIIGNLNNDGIRSFFQTHVERATALGATKGKSWSVGGNLGVGLGGNVATSSFTVGANFSYGRAQTEGLLTLADMNGDGLADKVFKQGKKVCYRPQIRMSETQFAFGNRVELNGLTDFLKESSRTITWGLQASAAVAISGTWPSTKSTTSTYMADINGDGLPDLVTDDGAYINSLDAQGNPTFSRLSTMTTPVPEQGETGAGYMETSATPCGGIIFDGIVSDSLGCRDTLLCRDTLAPNETGQIQAYTNQGYICETDTAHNCVYVYERQIVCEEEQEDPDLDAVRVWVAPVGGVVNIYSKMQLQEDTSSSRRQSRLVDGIAFSIQKDSLFQVNATDNGIISSHSRRLLEKTIGKDDYDLHEDSICQHHVKKGDILFFRLKSVRNRDYDKVTWQQRIKYLSITNSGTSVYTLPLDFDSKRDFVLSGEDCFQAYQSGGVDISGVVTADNIGQPARVRILKNNVCMDSADIPVNTSYSHVFLMTNQSVSANDRIKFEIVGTSANGNSDFEKIRFNPVLKYHSNFNGSTTDTLTYHPHVEYKINNRNNSRYDTLLHSLFGSLYRGWGQFAYHNNNTMGSDSLIRMDRLLLPRCLSAAGSMDSAYFTLNYSDFDTAVMDQAAVTETLDTIFNPFSQQTSWVEMRANTQIYGYEAYGNLCFVYADTMSNTRCIQYAPLERDSNGVAVETSGNIPDYDSPVPVSVNGEPVQTIRKQSRSKGTNASFSVGIGVSFSYGDNTILTDYMDLNGDRYPDFIGRDNVQYTMPWGGIGRLERLSHGKQELSSTTTIGIGITYGGGFPSSKRETSNDSKKAKFSVSGAGTSTGSDEVSYQLVDINGDGLPDMVSGNGIVNLNAGYRFLPPEYWGNNFIRDGGSVNANLAMNMDFSIAQYSISGGVGLYGSNNNTKHHLTDFNGDGLPDKVIKEDGSLIVSYNCGNGSWSTHADTVVAVSKISSGNTYSESIHAGVTAGFTVSVVKIIAGVQVSPFDRTFSTDNDQLVDINGDGYPDYVTSGSEERIMVRYNQAGKTNLLKKVTNFTNSTIELDYTLSIPSYEQPQRQWNLTEVVTTDPFSPLPNSTTKTVFAYAHPNYNRYERMDYGYGSVTTIQYAMPDNTPYRLLIEEFDNIHFNKLGKKRYECTADAAGNKYIETFYFATMMDRLGHPVADDECPAQVFTAQETEITNYYEAHDFPLITTRIDRGYDLKHNVVRYVSYGDTTHTQEYFVADITYVQNMPHNLIALPIRITVRDFDGDLLQQREATYDNAGKPVSIHHLVDENHHVYAETLLSYDEYGNIHRIEFPENYRHQRKMWVYDYDAVAHTYPAERWNEFGHHSHTDYDYRFGKPVLIRDICGNEIRYHYDDWGRTDTVIAPYEADAGVPFTWTAEYKLHYLTHDQYTNNTLSYATTRHFDVQHPMEPIQVTLLSNGWGKVIQTQKWGEVEGTPQCVVSGKTVDDCFGRTILKYHPFVIPITPQTAYYDSTLNGTQTETIYDILDRESGIILPTHETTRLYYDFEHFDGHFCFSTVTRDANDILTRRLTGTRGQLLQTIAPHQAITTFSYNPLGQLLTSTDPDNFTTTYTYDLLGNCIQRTHPDAGTDSYKYDPAGNLVLHANQKLQNANRRIEYHYTYNRLDSIIYPVHRQNNVRYTYGTPADAPNSLGRLVAVEDASGFQTFNYGKMGEVIENYRTFVLPNNPHFSYTFRMGYLYDSWNRILQMTYPDGEVVDYLYSLGGELDRMVGQKGNDITLFVHRTFHNKFGQRAEIVYGNGCHTTYQYDVLQRLENMTTQDWNGDDMQNITYQYDHVGNIVRMQNGTLPLPNGLGGAYDYQFVYDSLYRLVDGLGDWNNHTAYYRVRPTYFANGRMATKEVEVLPFPDPYYKYYYTYAYDNPQQPNTLTNILGPSPAEHRIFMWDANGNMQTQQYLANNVQIRHCWDEENRLQGVRNAQMAGYYQYDAQGERTYKSSYEVQSMMVNGHTMLSAIKPLETLYASPYMVGTRYGYTKHYFAGAERIASKTGTGGLADINQPVCTAQQLTMKREQNNILEDIVLHGCLQFANVESGNEQLKILHNLSVVHGPEQDCYWYHGDHIGSTAWVSGVTGTGIEHRCYLPFGEPFVTQPLPGAWNPRYTFSGKERDEETGYSYFGARYYQPSLSIWLSVDPMADKYPGVSPYAYCGDNPVRLVDPDGRKVKPFGETALETIKNTLKKEDRSYIKLNKQGLIRKLPLLLHKSESQNYASLKELVLSKHIVEIHTSDYFSYIDNNGESGTQKMSCSPYNPQLGGIKDVACEYVSGLSTGECGWYGETLFPDNKGHFNSTNANIQIYLHSSLSKVGMAEAFSHEGYGHALLYERNGGDHLGASHKPHGLTETNIVLKNMIITARRETLQNIEQ